MGEKKDVKFFNSTALYSRFHPDRYFVTTSTTEILLRIYLEKCVKHNVFLSSMVAVFTLDCFLSEVFYHKVSTVYVTVFSRFTNEMFVAWTVFDDIIF